MLLGILADIHEQVDRLDHAIEALRDRGVERFVVLGDLFATGARFGPTVDRLREIGAGGVWGNHDTGFCPEPCPATIERFTPEVMAYMATLAPFVRIADAHFAHVPPWLDPGKIEDIWYFGDPPTSPDDVAKCLAATDARVIFMGHFHDWRHVRESGPTGWSGADPLVLDRSGRHIVVMNAVGDGWSATYDTETARLEPIRLAGDWLEP